MAIRLPVMSTNGAGIEPCEGGSFPFPVLQLPSTLGAASAALGLSIYWAGGKLKFRMTMRMIGGKRTGFGGGAPKPVWKLLPVRVSTYSWP